MDITKVKDPKIKELHAECSFIKCYQTYLSMDVILANRELCGGHGYSSYAGIDEILKSQNV